MGLETPLDSALETPGFSRGGGAAKAVGCFDYFVYDSGAAQKIDKHREQDDYDPTTADDAHG